MSLAKIVHTDEQGSDVRGSNPTATSAEKDTGVTKENKESADANESFDENDNSRYNQIYSEMAQSMAMVDMGESVIRKIIPVSVLFYFLLSEATLFSSQVMASFPF
jgi:hypothetical protein